MGCFEDYMDFREEVDRIKKKDRVKEEPKSIADAKTDEICPTRLQPSAMKHRR